MADGREPGCGRGALDDQGDSRRDLLRRLQLALRIGQRTLQFLGKDGFSGSDVAEGNFAAEKPLAEAAMLLYVARAQRSHPEIRDAFDALLSELSRYARAQRVAWDVCRYPTVALQLATPHILLSALGNGDAAFDGLLAESVRHAAGHEVVPYRELEVMWLHAVWQARLPDERLAGTARRTALGVPIDLLGGTREDAYAHTHAPMYFTDFSNWRRPLPRRRQDFLGESAAVLARALIVEDYDLAAEALMGWPLFGARWSSIASFGFRVLASLEDKVGFLPAGRAASTRLLSLSGEERTKFALASCYHTAFVMGMLCGLLLSQDAVAPSRGGCPRSPPHLAEQLYRAAPRHGAHWEMVFEALPQDEQAALVPFLLNVGLLHSGRSNEAAQMAALLRIAVQHGMADSTLCAQAAELLSRQSLLAQRTMPAPRATRAA